MVELDLDAIGELELDGALVRHDLRRLGLSMDGLGFARRGPERCSEPFRGVFLFAVVRVAHRGPDLGVAEPGLELDYGLGAADRQSAERVAQVMEADGT